jgi:ribosomal protein L44E
MCGNCHCSDIDVLTIDHINNDGAKQRMNGMRDGNNLYRELSKVPKRNDLQVLCANCQWRKFICKDPIWLSKQGMKSFLAEKIKSTDLRYWKQYNLRIKHLVMKKYGGICTGCGCEDLLVLTIDHINNDGHKDRKEKRGQGFYMHLLKIPNRADLQVLCFNCQTKKAVLRARATRFSSRDLVAQASRSSALHIISV